MVPHELLDFSRAVLRERFSAVVHKPVLTFAFDRFTRVTPALERKLELAREQRAIVVTTPSSLKSFLLKLVETVHLLDKAAADEATALSLKPRGVRSLFRLRRRPTTTTGAALTADEVHELRQQAGLCARVLAVFQRSVLVLDEVDLLLHPLKSELHWPMGRKLPLNMTQSRAEPGLRWKVPFHLLDAIFFAQHGRTLHDWKGSAVAAAVLEGVRAVIVEGSTSHQLQTTPHLVLLAPSLYFRKLLPLLARWLLVWLQYAHPLHGFADATLLAYLQADPRLDAAAVVALHARTSDEHMQILNLGRTWLTSVLPHVLSKINRVHYGVFSDAELRRALQDNASMARSRQVGATPSEAPSRTLMSSH